MEHIAGCKKAPLELLLLSFLSHQQPAMTRICAGRERINQRGRHGALRTEYLYVDRIFLSKLMSQSACKCVGNKRVIGTLTRNTATR